MLAGRSGARVAALAAPWTLIVGLIAVALVLLIAFRGDRRRTLVPLVPIALATGWSALVLFVVRVPLNPMSVTLGALVIAISTEFSVLLSERYRQERLAGHDTVEALRRSYRRTGAAVAASGVTAIVGFGVLALSDIRMLRDFGLVTLVDLSVSLVGVLVALPAALVLADAAAATRRSREPVGPAAGSATSSRPARTTPISPAGAPGRAGAGGARCPPPGAPRWAGVEVTLGGRLERRPAPPGPPRYGRYVGLLALVILALITVNTIVTKPNGDTGIPTRHRRHRSPSRSRSRRVGDADIATTADQGAGRCPRARSAVRRSSTSASSTNAGRWCSRCSSTRAPARGPEAICRALVPPFPVRAVRRRGDRGNGRPCAGCCARAA